MFNKIINYFINKQEVVAIYLFGSYAAGKERKFSDLDIGILLNKTDDCFIMDKTKTYTTELGRILRKDIHPTILNHANEALLRQIFLKGRCLLINDPAILAQFKMAALTKIAEFAYYREQMEKGFLRKLIGVAVG